MQEPSPHTVVNVSAAIITYNPDSALLARAVSSLLPQVRTLLVVDNGSDFLPALPEADAAGRRARLVPLGENRGIAAATNAALDLLRADGAAWVITSDQDTVYPPDYVETFLRLLAACPYGTDSVAAFVPVFHDGVLGRTSPVYVRSRGLMRRTAPDAPYTKVAQAIASGMLVNMAALDAVGPMDGDLFIDMVDSEWCWRANGRGLCIVCLRDLEVSHRLGDRAARLGPWRVAVRSPARHYYMTRNGVHLALRSAYLPLPDRVLLFVKSLRFIFLYPLLCNDPLLNLRSAIRGFLDALMGRLGRMGPYGTGSGIPGECPGSVPTESVPASPAHPIA